MHFFSGNTNVVLYFPNQSDWHRSSCLLALEAFERQMCPSVSRSLIFVVGRGASAFCRNTGSPRSVLSQRPPCRTEPHPARAALGTARSRNHGCRRRCRTSNSEVISRVCASYSRPRKVSAGRFPRSMRASSFSHSPVMAHQRCVSSPRN